MKNFFYFTLLIFSCMVICYSCKHDVPKVEPALESNYPPEIAKIISGKCATAGCHNAISYAGAGDLRLDSWEAMFKGGSNGAVVIPYSTENSSLLYFINTDVNLGPTAKPVMPYDPANPTVGKPLSTDEYITIRDWIANGAPDKNGNIPFAPNADTRQKIYITMQGCDQVAVVDAATRVVMRYIPVGIDQAKIEVPHCVRVDAQGRYAYVSFLDGTAIQKIDTRTDTVIAAANVGQGYWNIVQPSPDGTKLLTTDWESNGKALLIDAVTMSVITTVPNLLQPHGIACSSDNIFYVTSEAKNVIYKISFTAPFIKEVKIGNLSADSLISHEIMLVPGEARYFVTCRAFNEVRVVDAKADTLMKVIPVGGYPQELAMSSNPATPYMFVTCMEDAGAGPGFRGCVYAINYNTYETTRIDGPFYQPHGITVDDANGVFYVASANLSSNGPPPHHVSSCAGRNGYYNTFDLKTLQRLPTRNEVLVAPYSADTRFK